MRLTAIALLELTIVPALGATTYYNRDSTTKKSARVI